MDLMIEKRMSLGIKDIYKNYKEEGGNLEYSDFAIILKEFNKEAVTAMIEEGGVLSLNTHKFNLGRILVKKCKRTKKAINMYETRKQGKTIYFEDPYYCAFIWEKPKFKTKGLNYEYYKFKPSEGKHTSIHNLHARLMRYINSNDWITTLYERDKDIKFVKKFYKGDHVGTFKSYEGAAKDVKVHPNSIRRACKKSYYSCKGFQWKVEYE